MNRVSMLACLGLLVACSGPSEVVVDLEPDPARTGLAGDDGPFGVAHATFAAQARVTDAVTYEVAWPARKNGDFDRSGGRCPIVGFVHGGLVEADRYRWIVTHFASRGYCVLSADHDLDLAIFESDNTSLALDDLERRAEAGKGPLAGNVGNRAVVMGHSLGGVVSAFRWVADERFEGVGILASWAAAGTPVEDQKGRPSLSIIGSEDRSGEATREAYEQYERFPQPGWFGVVQGMNHYDWADDPSDSNLLSDGVPTRPREETRRDAAMVLDLWLDGWLRDDADALATLDAHDFEHVTEAP